MPNPQLTLLSLPNAEAPKLIKIVKECTDSKIDIKLETEIKRIEMTLANGQLEQVGIMLAEPATRLWKTYCAFNQNAEFDQSFQDFYQSETRINIYHRAFKEVSLKNFGFVGTYDAFYHTVLLSEQWHLSRLRRIPYGLLLADDFAYDTHSSLIKEMGEKAYSEIRKLYAKDYEIFAEAQRLVLARWKQMQKKIEIPISASKQVYIHVGPPKTGTSAIQSWLNNSIKELKAHGIFYPSHKFDKNGISSGNFEEIVTITGEGNRYFDDEKASVTLSKFTQSSYKTLLLSSEHFFYYLLWFFSRLPKSKFIFYIRHPIASLESSFHQEVKRHGRTKNFTLPRDLGFYNLLVISHLSRAFGVEVEYRYYGNETFEGGTLFTDFARCFDSFIDPPKSSKRLNTQYSAGALRLMRAANSVAEKALLQELDLFLQKESEKVDNFSLLSLKEVSEFQKKLGKHTENLLSTDAKLEREKMYRLLSSYEHVGDVHENVVIDDLKCLVEKLAAKNPDLTARLYDLLSENQELISDEALLELLRQNKVSRWSRYFFRIIRKLGFRVS